MAACREVYDRLYVGPRFTIHPGLSSPPRRQAVRRAALWRPAADFPRVSFGRVQGLDLFANNVLRQDKATQHWQSVNLNGACPALAQFTSVLGSCQGHLLAEHFQQGLMWRERHLVRLAVHLKRRKQLVGLSHRGQAE